MGEHNIGGNANGSCSGDDDADGHPLDDETDAAACVKVKQIFCQHDLLAQREAAVRFCK